MNCGKVWVFIFFFNSLVELLGVLSGVCVIYKV